jgi:hypothetical protein
MLEKKRIQLMMGTAHNNRLDKTLSRAQEAMKAETAKDRKTESTAQSQAGQKTDKQ